MKVFSIHLNTRCSVVFETEYNESDYKKIIIQKMRICYTDVNTSVKTALSEQDIMQLYKALHSMIQKNEFPGL